MRLLRAETAAALRAIDPNNQMHPAVRTVLIDTLNAAVDAQETRLSRTEMARRRKEADEAATDLVAFVLAMGDPESPTAVRAASQRAAHDDRAARLDRLDRLAAAQHTAKAAADTAADARTAANKAAAAAKAAKTAAAYKVADAAEARARAAEAAAFAATVAVRSFK